MDEIRIQTEPFDVTRETETLRAGRSGIGAIATFTGYVRDQNGGQGVLGLQLEHYPGMAEREIGQILAEARRRWQLEALRVVHRVGHLKPGDPIVLVAVGSAHRAEAFAACEFIMDYLKTSAPFWKKEQGSDGSGRWLDARESDNQRRRRWEK